MKINNQNTKNTPNFLLKKIPSIDLILKEIDALNHNLPYSLIKNIVQNIVNNFRYKIIKDNYQSKDIKDEVITMITAKISNYKQSQMRNVINATGIILHTGLGRAPLSMSILKKSIENIYPYSNLELDLLKGKRGDRNNHIQEILCSLTQSESSLISNNNASAVILMLNSLASNKEVIISRGQQVEIGGSFRIPDIILKSNCKMIEVGTTNKTHIKDYKEAITDSTAAILYTHTSNYKVVGFSNEIDIKELVNLCKKQRILLIMDLGSGTIADFSEYELPFEYTIKEYIKMGVSVLSFSGDKLLGGPQAGIICGKKRLINKIKMNPLYRAFRCDKMRITILENILKTYIQPNTIHKDNLTITLFTRNIKSIYNQAEKVFNAIHPSISKRYEISLIDTLVEAGSGSLPIKEIKSYAIQIKSQKKVQELATQFRNAEIPVIGYVKTNKFFIDFRAIPKNQSKSLIEIINNTLA